MPRQLFAVPRSPPCRNVTLILDFLGLEYEFKNADPIDGETKTPEFAAMSIQHAIPVFVDFDGFSAEFSMNDSLRMHWLDTRNDGWKCVYKLFITEMNVPFCIVIILVIEILMSLVCFWNSRFVSIFDDDL